MKTKVNGELELFVDETNQCIVLQIGSYYAHLSHHQAQTFGLGFIKAALHLEMLLNGDLLPPNEPPN